VLLDAAAVPELPDPDDESPAVALDEPEVELDEVTVELDEPEVELEEDEPAEAAALLGE
jgi:hypothetical protein